MARPLPNPVSDHEKGQLDTLRDALYQQTETQKWSKNVDINTFRTHTDTKQGFKSLSAGFASSNKNWQIAIQQGKTLNQNLDPEEQESVWQGLKSGVIDMFGVVTGPLKQLGHALELSGQKFETFMTFDIITPMESFKRGTSQMGKGFKELGNGIGAFGPIMNTFKTAFYKLTAVANVLWGTLRLVIAGIKGLGKGIFNLVKGFVWLAKGAWALITNFRETVGKMKDAVMGFAGNMKDKVKGWFTADPEEAVKDALDEDKESGGFEGGGRMIEILESIAGALGVEKSPTVSAETPEEIFATEMQKIGEEEAERQRGIDEESAKRNEELSFAKEKNDKSKAKHLHKLKIAQLKKQGIMMMKQFLLPLLLGIAAFLLLWKAWDEWKPLTGISIAIKEAGKKMIGKITGIFTGLTKTLAEKFPRLFGGLAKTIPPGPGSLVDDVIKGTGGGVDDIIKGGASGVDEAAKITGGVADDAAKAAAKAAAAKAAAAEAAQLAKAAKVSKLVTGLKVVGRAAGPVAAVGEAALDWSDQNEKFERLKVAYETGEKLPMPDGAGGTITRAITDKEFELIERAHIANRAGSVGKGGGSLAAASAAAAVAAPLLATGPLGWLAYGGIVIGSAIVGGMAGDKAATNMFEGGEIDDAQKLIDDFYANLPALPKPTTSEDMKLLNDDVKDSAATTGTAGGSPTIVSSVDTSVNTANNYTKERPMDDESLKFSQYPFGHAGAARP